MIPSSDQIASDSRPNCSRIRLRERQAPGGVHAPAVRAQHAQAPVADLVAEALDDDRAVARDDARGLLLLAQVVEEVARGALVEVVVALRAISSFWSTAQRLNSPIASPSSFGRPTLSPFQNGTAPGTPGAGVTTTRSRPISSIRQVDAPSRNVWPARAS